MLRLHGLFRPICHCLLPASNIITVSKREGILSKDVPFLVEELSPVFRHPQSERQRLGEVRVWVLPWFRLL